MEKPTEFIKSIINNLNIINNIENGYSVLEKDIILHNLREAYLHFLNISAEDSNREASFQLNGYQNNPEQERKIAQMEIQLQQSAKEKEALAAQLAGLTAQYSEKLKSAEVQIETLSKNEEALRTTLAEKNALVETLSLSSSNFNSALAKKNALIDNLQKEIAEKENTICSLQQQLNQPITPAIEVVAAPVEVPAPDKLETNLLEEDNLFIDEIEEKEPDKQDVSVDDSAILTFTDTKEEPVIITIPEPEKVEEIKFPEIDLEEDLAATTPAVEQNPRDKEDDKSDLLFNLDAQPVPTPEPKQHSLFDNSEPLYKSEKKSLNDLLSDSREDHSLGAKFQNARVKDLAKAIALNDKFLFIRELFRNRGEEFSKAIQQLNACENIDAAFELMETMKMHYAWDTTSQAYLKLCDLIRRKYVD